MFSSFRLNIAIRVLLIAGLAVAFALVLTKTTWFFTPLIIALCWIAIIINLIVYIERTNKDLTSFLLNVRQGDYTTSTTSGKRGKSFLRLSKAFDEVIGELEKLNFERETHYQYLQTLTENIGVGIISYDERGKVQLINPEAKRLLNTTRLSTVDALAQVHPKLLEVVNELHSGQRQLIQLPIGNETPSLSIHLKELKLNETFYKVVMLQDLRSELEEKEVEAWQKLIRVLTHEIMNSVTPIVTLSEAVNRIVRQSDGAPKQATDFDTEELTDIYESLATIETRSKGLLKFINAYKNFSKSQEAKLARTRLAQLATNVIKLLKPEFEARNIQVETELTEEFVIADESLTEQVIINLVRNAMDALSGKESPRILLGIKSSGPKAMLIITDNGPGIEPELMEKIFVPFFTTKKTGTGVGLSWSRQVMRLQGGNLLLRSQLGKGTLVELQFQSA